MLAIGCMGGELIPIPHDQHTFVDDRRLLLVETEPARIVVDLYDVESKQVIWRNELPGTTFVVSKNGRYAALLAFIDDTPDGHGLAVLDLEKGALARLDVRISRGANLDTNELYRQFQARSATSDDGRYVATMVDNELRVYDVRTRQLAWSLSVPQWKCVVSFAPAGHDLVLECLTPGPLGTVTQLIAEGQAWRTGAVTSGFGAAFTDRGLMLFVAEGIARLENGVPKVIAPGFRASDGYFSPDGRYVQYHRGLQILDLDSNRDVMSGNLSGSVRFRGHTAFVFQDDGELWRYDLTNGSRRKLRSFGKPADTVKIPFAGGTTTDSHYDYDMSNDGRYLYYQTADLNERLRGRIFKLEKL